MRTIQILWLALLGSIPSALGAGYASPITYGSVSDLTNSWPYNHTPTAIVLSTNPATPSVVYRYVSNSTDTVDVPWVLPARTGGRWVSSVVRHERVSFDGSASGIVTVYHSAASVLVSTGALTGPLTYSLSTNASVSGGSRPARGATVRFVRPLSSGNGTNTISVVGSETNSLAAGAWMELAWTSRDRWEIIGQSAAASSSSTVRVVEQDINSTSLPIAVNGSSVTHYFFTGAATNTGPQTYVLPTNDVPTGALLSVSIVGTNFHPSLPILYDFVASGVTNRLKDSNRVDFVYTGTTWIRKPWLDNAIPANGYLYGIADGAAQEIPIQTDASGDNTPWMRFNSQWRRLVAGANVTVTTNIGGEVVVSSSGGGGGPTNGTAVFVDGAFTSSANFSDTSEIDHSISGTNVSSTIIPGSIQTNKVSSGFRAFFLDRGGHTGTQLVATISDWATNFWSKVITIFQRGNGINFQTNAGANTLTISGWYLPGANTTFTTNGDGSITIAASASGSTNGTPISVNGGPILTLANLADTVIAKWAAAGSNITLIITNLQQSAVSNLVSDLAAKQAFNTNLLQIATAAGTPGDVLYRHSSGVMTNLPVGSNGQVLTVASGAPSWVTPTSGGGGGSTNATYTTNKVDVPVYLSTDTVTVSSATTNETSLVGTLKSGQSKMTAANTLVSGTVLRIRAHGTLSAAGDWSNGRFRVKIGSRVLDAQLYEPDSLTPSGLPWQITAYLHVNAAGASASNTVVGVLSYGHGSASSVGANMVNMAASGSLNTTVTNAVDVSFENDGSQPVTLTCSAVEVYRLADELVTGGAGLVFANGALVENPNFTDGTGVNLSVTNGTNVVVELEDSGATAGTYTNPVVTIDSKGRPTSIASGPRCLFTLTVGHNAAGALASATTYLVPRNDSRIWGTALNWNQANVNVPYKCRIVAMVWRFRNSTLANPTGQSVVWYVRTNDVADIPVLTNSYADAGQYSTNISGLDIRLNAGNSFAAKVSIPTLTTGPSSGGMIDLYLEPME